MPTRRDKDGNIAESQKKAMEKYHKENLRTFKVVLNKKTDSELIEYLESKESMSKWIKQACIEKIERDRSETE